MIVYPNVAAVIITGTRTILKCVFLSFIPSSYRTWKVSTGTVGLLHRTFSLNPTLIGNSCWLNARMRSHSDAHAQKGCARICRGCSLTESPLLEGAVGQIYILAYETTDMLASRSSTFPGLQAVVQIYYRKGTRTTWYMWSRPAQDVKLSGPGRVGWLERRSASAYRLRVAVATPHFHQVGFPV